MHVLDALVLDVLLQINQIQVLAHDALAAGLGVLFNGNIVVIAGSSSELSDRRARCSIGIDGGVEGLVSCHEPPDDLCKLLANFHCS